MAQQQQRVAVIPWGFYTWHAIHYVALGYPDQPSEDDKATYTLFFKTLGKVLPCKLCVSHYEQHLAQHPIHDSLESKAKLFAWTVGIHNAVNRSLGKREYSVEEAQTYLLSLAVTDPRMANTLAEKDDSTRASRLSTPAIVLASTLVIAAAVGAWYVLVHKRKKTSV